MKKLYNNRNRSTDYPIKLVTVFIDSKFALKGSFKEWEFKFRVLIDNYPGGYEEAIKFRGGANHAFLQCVNYCINSVKSLLGSEADDSDFNNLVFSVVSPSNDLTTYLISELENNKESLPFMRAVHITKVYEATMDESKLPFSHPK